MSVSPSCLKMALWSLASPLWNKFMYPPWNAQQMESDGRGPNTQTIEGGEPSANKALAKVPAKDMAEGRAETVDFSGDDCKALLSLLQIVHLQFGKIPTEVSSISC